MILVRGHVQDVGFVWWARRWAHQLRLTGYAREINGGQVEIMAQGPREQLLQLMQLIHEPQTTTRRPGRVVDALCRFEPPVEGLYAFHAA